MLDTEKIIYQQLKLPKKPDRDYFQEPPSNYYRGNCIKGYIPYSDHKVVDLKNRRVCEVSYQGKCLAVGLLNGELHWWTFPKADRRVKWRHRIDEPEDLCSDS